MTTWSKLIPTIALYKLARSLNLKSPFPINITVSVTNLCNSRCKTCFIWKLYDGHSKLMHDEFKTWEFERTFQSIGKEPIWFTLSGGEPFLRHDIVKICEAICEFCSPYIVNIATNGLLPRVIEGSTKKILEQCDDVQLIVNLSLDGIGEKHDRIRGIKGNFDRCMDTFQRLRRLKADFCNFHVGIHSVISKYNIDDVLGLYEFVRELGPDSYITEVAEERTELFTVNSGITPDPALYAKTIDALSGRIRNDYLRSKGFIYRVAQALRLTYYEIVAQELWRHEQVVPCYAGYASCQITPYGDVWPCCVLGYDKSMGNLRESDFDFKKIWFSRKAGEVREYIRGKNCACPLANAHYTNIICNFKEIAKVLKAMK